MRRAAQQVRNICQQFRPQRLDQLFGAHIAFFQHDLRHGSTACQCLACNLGCGVIADQRIERRRNADRFFQSTRHDIDIGGNADDAAFRKRPAGGAELSDAFRQGPHDDRLEGVQLKLTALCGHGDGDVVADDHEGDLVDDFRDHRIDLAGHDA